MTGPSHPKPRDAIELAVFEAFQEILAREPTEAERVDWAAKLLRGVPVRQLRAALLEAPRHPLRTGAAQSPLPSRAAPAQASAAGDRRASDAENSQGLFATENPLPSAAENPQAFDAKNHRDGGPDLAAEIARIEATGLFDAAWYCRRYPDIAEAGMDPARHYAEHGAREDRAPNPYFDPAWYRAARTVPPHESPLLHYALIGEARGWPPSPRFDPIWYRTIYGSGDVALDTASGAASDTALGAASPLADFLRRRGTGTVAPSPQAWAALGLPPSRTADGPADDAFLILGDEPADVAVLRDSGLFDENYYALHSGDVLATGTDLLAHYCEFGWREGRTPNFYFDPRWYAATNPEVTRLGVNPLAHYLVAGEPAGRRPVVYFDPVWYRDTHALPASQSALGHFLAHRRQGTVSPNRLFDPAWYAARKGEPVRSGRDPFARFLVAGLTEDVPPSPDFDLAAWRKKTRGRVSRHFRHLLDPSRDNPLVDYLLREYR